MRKITGDTRRWESLGDFKMFYMEIAVHCLREATDVLLIMEKLDMGG